ncbi:MAG: helix-turn-helix transcriptional regulator [Bacteroidetes bacterium]|nr:helix-turn-helix transcriptional regulator [Bacteroidota bacterium]
MRTFSSMRKPKLSKLDIAVLKDVRHYIDNNLDIDLSVKSIATKFTMSDITLSRHFRIYYKIPLYTFVLQKRMQKALHEILFENEVSLKEIARNIGYKQYTSFIHAFSRHYGFSPSDVPRSSTNNC